jgi:hypothetical protein
MHSKTRRLVLLGVLLQACTQNPHAALREANARFGVLFGGQLQERNEIPFVLDPMKQSLALQLDFQTPLKAAATAHWELSKPGPRRGAYQLSSPEDRTTEFGDEVLNPGQQRLEKRLTLKPGDNLGLWNIRVSVGDHVLLDRPFTVYDPATRPRKSSLLGDAGR